MFTALWRLKQIIYRFLDAIKSFIYFSNFISIKTIFYFQLFGQFLFLGLFNFDIFFGFSFLFRSLSFLFTFFNFVIQGCLLSTYFKSLNFKNLNIQSKCGFLQSRASHLYFKMISCLFMTFRALKSIQVK